MILLENELFAQFVLLSGLKIYFFWQKYTSQTKYFFGSLINWSPCLNVKALVGAFNQEKALVGAFSVIVQLHRWIVLQH
jgi:hypothetical protein